MNKKNRLTNVAELLEDRTMLSAGIPNTGNPSGGAAQGADTGSVQGAAIPSQQGQPVTSPAVSTFLDQQLSLANSSAAEAASVGSGLGQLFGSLQETGIEAIFNPESPQAQSFAQGTALVNSLATEIGMIGDSSLSAFEELSAAIAPSPMGENVASQQTQSAPVANPESAIIEGVYGQINEVNSVLISSLTEIGANMQQLQELGTAAAGQQLPAESFAQVQQALPSLVEGLSMDIPRLQAVADGGQQRLNAVASELQLPSAANQQPAAGVQAAPGQAGPMQVAPGQAGPIQVAPGQAGPRQVAPGQAGPMQIAPGQAGPRQVASGQAGPMQVAPGQAGPRQVAPGQAGPSQVAPGQAGPMQVASGQAGPRQAAPGQAGPMQVASGPAGPSQVASGQAGPSQAASGQAGPSQAALAQQAAIEQLAAGEQQLAQQAEAIAQQESALQQQALAQQAAIEQLAAGEQQLAQQAEEIAQRESALQQQALAQQAAIEQLAAGEQQLAQQAQAIAQQSQAQQQVVAQSAAQEMAIAQRAGGRQSGTPNPSSLRMQMQVARSSQQSPMATGSQTSQWGRSSRSLRNMSSSSQNFARPRPGSMLTEVQNSVDRSSANAVARMQSSARNSAPSGRPSAVPAAASPFTIA